MSDKSYTFYFGIENVCGLMDVLHQKRISEIDSSQYILKSYVKNPIFSTQGYKIKTVLSPKDKNNNDSMYKIGNVYDGKTLKEYTKAFRKYVLWDFGDGTQVQGAQVEHFYKKPGKYTISCLLIDKNNVAHENKYTVTVIVKEVIQTFLQFDESVLNQQKITCKCSQIKKICKLNCYLGNQVQDELKVNVKRVFQSQEYDQNNVEIYRNFKDIPNHRFKFMQKYWTILENTNIYSNDVELKNLVPSQKFSPKYNNIYGRFYKNDQGKIDFQGYILSNAKTTRTANLVDKSIKNSFNKIKIISPNNPVLYNQYDGSYIDCLLTQTNKIPQGYFYMGKKASIDVFYKNDFISNNNVISMFYDLQGHNVTGELKSSPNYLNTIPLGLIVDIEKNELDGTKIGLSLDCFLRDDVNDGWNYSIDNHLLNSLYKNLAHYIFMFPYKLSDSIKNSFSLDQEKRAYYIPKDLIFDNVKCESSLVQNNTKIQFSDFAYSSIDGKMAYLYIMGILVNDVTDINIGVQLKDYAQDRFSKYDISLKKKSTNFSDVIIPTEKYTVQSMKQLSDAYMPHKMFEQTDNLKQMFELIFDKDDTLNYILTKGQNFIEDTSQSKTCYIHNLISQLKMFGQQCMQFQQSSFQGLKQLKDVTRILSMNHGDLVGHTYSNPSDIKVTNQHKGDNVGNKLQTDWILYVIKGESNKHRGKIKALRCQQIGCNQQGHGQIHHLNHNGLELNNGTEIIIRDKFTNQTKIVNFALAIQQDDWIQNQYAELQICDYRPSWGWNLILPDRVAKITKQIDSYFISNSQRDKLRQVYRNIINGFYDFYLLIPNEEKERFGNFIDSKYIDEQMENVESWNDKWGRTHDYLMKVLNQQLVNIQFDTAIEKRLNYINDDLVYSVVDLHNQDITRYVKLEGNVTISSENKLIQGQNRLSVCLEDCIINEQQRLVVQQTSSIIIEIDQYGYINEVEKQFIIRSQNNSGTSGVLLVNISGNCLEPQIKTSTKIQFIDSIEKNINYSTTVITNGISNARKTRSSNSEIINEANAQLKVDINGTIDKLKDNVLTISLSQYNISCPMINVVFDEIESLSMTVDVDYNRIILNDGIPTNDSNPLIKQIELIKNNGDYVIQGKLTIKMWGNIDNICYSTKLSNVIVYKSLKDSYQFELDEKSYLYDGEPITIKENIFTNSLSQHILEDSIGSCDLCFEKSDLGYSCRLKLGFETDRLNDKIKCNSVLQKTENVIIDKYGNIETCDIVLCTDDMIDELYTDNENQEIICPISSQNVICTLSGNINYIDSLRLQINDSKSNVKKTALCFCPFDFSKVFDVQNVNNDDYIPYDKIEIQTSCYNDDGSKMILKSSQDLKTFDIQKIDSTIILSNVYGKTLKIKAKVVNPENQIINFDQNNNILQKSNIKMEFDYKNDQIQINGSYEISMIDQQYDIVNLLYHARNHYSYKSQIDFSEIKVTKTDSKNNYNLQGNLFVDGSGDGGDLATFVVLGNVFANNDQKSILLKLNQEVLTITTRIDEKGTIINDQYHQIQMIDNDSDLTTTHRISAQVKLQGNSDGVQIVFKNGLIYEVINNTFEINKSFDWQVEKNESNSDIKRATTRIISDGILNSTSTMKIIHNLVTNDENQILNKQFDSLHEISVDGYGSLQNPVCITQTFNDDSNTYIFTFEIDGNVSNLRMIPIMLKVDSNL